MPSSEFATFTSVIDIVYLFCAVGCVVCAALAAGMTMGLLSLDSLKLRIKLRTGTERERAAVKQILPLLDNHHLLLCTLLLFNAAANEALPIFLDAIVPAWAAIIIAVTLVLICGEIVPTALFTGPNQLQIAARFTPLVYFLQFSFYPVAYPMARLLDYILGEGEDDDNLNRDEISAMMKILQENRIAGNIANADQNANNDSLHSRESRSTGASRSKTTSKHTSTSVLETATKSNSGKEDEEPLTHNEVNVITGVLALAKKTIRDVYVPINEVNMVSADQQLDAETLEVIEKVGNSRLPVFKGTDIHHILGFLRVKKLLRIPTDRQVFIGTLPLIKPIAVGCNQSLLDVLTIFQSGHSHLALVSEDPEILQEAIDKGHAPPSYATPMGIVSIEDILEEMLQGEILDEEDITRSPADALSASVTLREMSMRASYMSPIDISLDTKTLQEREAQKKLREKALLHGNPPLLPVQEAGSLSSIFQVATIPAFNPMAVSNATTTTSALHLSLQQHHHDSKVVESKESALAANETESSSPRQLSAEDPEFKLRSSSLSSDGQRLRVYSSEESRRKLKDERRRVLSTNAIHNKQSIAGLKKLAQQDPALSPSSAAAANRLTPSIVKKYIRNRSIGGGLSTTDLWKLEQGDGMV